MGATLYFLVAAMRSTKTTELQYLIQRTAPTFLTEMGSAHALSEKL